MRWLKKVVQLERLRDIAEVLKNILDTPYFWLGVFAYLGGYFIGGWRYGFGFTFLFLAAVAFLGIIEEHS